MYYARQFQSRCFKPTVFPRSDMINLFRNIMFRGARAEDAPRAVGLIYSAGPEALTYAFATRKNRPQDFIGAAFTEGSGTIGYKNHVVAVVNGMVAGIGAFYSTDAYDRLSFETVWQIFRFYGLFESWGVLRRSGRLETLTPRPESNALFIQNIGIAREMRGMGMGQALIEHGLEAARRENYRKCLLDVATTNTHARKLYEKLGFRIVGTREFNYDAGAIQVPGQFRMALDLK